MTKGVDDSEGGGKPMHSKRKFEHMSPKEKWWNPGLWPSVTPGVNTAPDAEMKTHGTSSGSRNFRVWDTAGPWDGAPSEETSVIAGILTSSFVIILSQTCLRGRSGVVKTGPKTRPLWNSEQRFLQNYFTVTSNSRSTWSHTLRPSRATPEEQGQKSLVRAPFPLRWDTMCFIPK